MPPQTLKQVLIDTTRKSQGPEWNGRLGYGVLNAGDACKRLSIDSRDRVDVLVEELDGRDAVVVVRTERA